MSILLGVITPLFGIVGLGFLAARYGVLDRSGVRGLVLFVFNFAIPVLLFRSLAAIQLPDDVPWSFLAAFYGGSLITYAGGVALGRFVHHRGLDEQAIFGMGAAFSNTVLLGIPIVLTAFGPEATLPLFLIIAFHSATLMPLTVGLIHVARGEGISAREQAASVAGELLKNPIVVGLFLGLLANLLGLGLPGPVDRLTELLGDAAVPCALFAMGASLAAYPAGAEGRQALELSGLKLIVHPILVWLLAVPVLGLEGIWVSTAVTMAALPSGVNVYLFGARYGAAAAVAARTVLVTAVLSVATLTLLLMILATTGS